MLADECAVFRPSGTDDLVVAPYSRPILWASQMRAGAPTSEYPGSGDTTP